MFLMCGKISRTNIVVADGRMKSPAAMDKRRSGRLMVIVLKVAWSRSLWVRSVPYTRHVMGGKLTFQQFLKCKSGSESECEDHHDCSHAR
jgi:hypothetical protein